MRAEKVKVMNKWLMKMQNRLKIQTLRITGDRQQPFQSYRLKERRVINIMQHTVS